MAVSLRSFSILMMVVWVLGCGGSEPAPLDCVEPKDGVLVGVACEDGKTINGLTTPTASEPVDVTATENSPTTDPNLSNGANVFLQASPLACATCHVIDSLPGAVGQIGPDLSLIGAKGEAHIRESIINPNAVITEECPGELPCQPDVMIQTYGTDLTSEELESLVSYLATLK